MLHFPTLLALIRILFQMDDFNEEKCSFYYSNVLIEEIISYTSSLAPSLYVCVLY